MDQKQWIEKARDGDKEAFCELYDMYKDRLYRYALYKLGNAEDAEDAVQECVLAAWRQIGQLREAGAFGTWMFRILSACCKRDIRGKIRDREGTEALRRESALSEPALTGYVELEEALSELDDRSRDIVLMAVVGDLTSAEIAEITGMTAGGVRSRLSRSLAKMRKYLEEE